MGVGSGEKKQDDGVESDLSIWIAVMRVGERKKSTAAETEWGTDWAGDR